MGFIVFPLLIGLTGAVLINENVIFHKTNDITTTRARWLASFVIDLKPLGQFIEKLGNDIEIATDTASYIIDKYNHPNKDEYLSTFRALQKEVQFLNSTQMHLMQGFLDFQLLHPRPKRGLFDIGGHALKFLFGVCTQDDLKSIKRNIATLAKNQEQVMHIVKESLSVINMTRFEVAKNRQVLIELVGSVQALDTKLEKLVSGLQKQIYETRYFLEMYLRLDLIVSEIQSMLSNAMFYLEHIKTQLNFLSLGRLSPSNLSPASMKSLLISIKSHLPPTLTLIGDSNTDLWVFYRQLKTIALIDNDQVVVIIHIPILQIISQYEIYKIFSVPLVTQGMQTDDNQISEMTATLNLESNGLMINKDRTKYTLLTDQELDKCSDPNVNWCSVASPIFPVNVAKLCIVNLFLKNRESSWKYCQTIVNLNTRLPFAISLFNSLWAIATQNDLKFAIVCNDGTSRTELVKSPIGILEIPSICTASNDNMVLSPTFTEVHGYDILDGDIELLRHINKSQTKIWSALIENFPNFTKIDLPISLKQLDQIPLDSLISQLQNYRSIDEDASNDWPNWAYVCTGAAVGMVILLCVYLYKQNESKIRTACYDMRNRGEKEAVSGTETRLMSVSTKLEGQPSTAGGPDLSAPTNPDASALGRIYPTLFREEVTHL